jgi:hypothetical protein
MLKKPGNRNSPVVCHPVFHNLEPEVYESIHKAAQYKSSGAMQTAANMNESDGITMGLKGCSNTCSFDAEESEAAARKYCET